MMENHEGPMGIYVHDPSITRLLHLEPSSVTNGHEGMGPHISKKHHFLPPYPWIYTPSGLLAGVSLGEPANNGGWGNFCLSATKS
jgi:hypothetical protein